MNFLAHTQLSPNNDDIIFGNFIADAVKGKSYSSFRNDIIKGILLHRNIDWFTDHNAIVSHSKSIVRQNFGKYSGIVVDIYYDHFLARNWETYSNIDLAKHSRSVYTILAKRFVILPNRVKRMLPFLIAQNWLTGYANFTDLQRVFNGMNRRTNNISEMNTAVTVLENNYDELLNDFNNFYPELELFSKNKLNEIIV